MLAPFPPVQPMYRHEHVHVCIGQESLSQLRVSAALRLVAAVYLARRWGTNGLCGFSCCSAGVAGAAPNVAARRNVERCAILPSCSANLYTSCSAVHHVMSSAAVWHRCVGRCANALCMVGVVQHRPPGRKPYKLPSYVMYQTTCIL